MGKKHIKLPRRYNPPGKHTPPESLAYLSEAEHEMLRHMTDGTASKGPKGVRSYADDSASSRGVSRPPSGTRAGSQSGTGRLSGTGGGGSTRSGASGMSAGRSGTGGGNRSGASGMKAGKTGASKSQQSSKPGAQGTRTAPRAFSGIGSPGANALGRVAQQAQGNAGRGPVNTYGAISSREPYAHKMMSPGDPRFTRNPTQFSRAIDNPNMVNRAGVPVVTWSKAFDPNKLTPLTQKQYQAVSDTAFRLGQPIDFFSGRAGRASGTPQHPAGLAMDMRLNNPVTGKPLGGYTNPIFKRGRDDANAFFESTYRPFANSVYDTVYKNPDAYSGLVDNMRWGGNFGGRYAKDYMHFDTNVDGGMSAAAQSFDRNAMARAERGPLSSGTALAGGGLTAPVSGTPAAPTMPVQLASAALGNVPIPRPRPSMPGAPIPRPRPLQSFVGGDPRASMQPGAFPAATPERILSVENYIDPATRVDRNVFDEGRAFGVPRARPPVQGPPRPIGGMSFNPSLPGPMKQFYDRVAQEQGPQSVKQFHDRLPQSPRGVTLPGPMPPSMPRGSVMPGPMTPSMPRGTVTGGPMTPFGSLPPAPVKQPKLSWADNSRDVPPGHWGREEANYLTQIGAMNAIKSDPYAAAGYAAMQNPDGSGLMLNGDTADQSIYGRFAPKTNEVFARVGLKPSQYGSTVAHELGHVGSYTLNGGFPHGPEQEEVRQRVVDAQNSPKETFNVNRMMAEGYLQNPHIRSGMGMALTPQLPGPMPRGATLAGPMPPQMSMGSVMPGPMPPSGIPAPAPHPFNTRPDGGVYVEPHPHTAPPAPWQYRNEAPPAAPHPATPGSQTAETEPSLWDNPGAWFEKKTGIDPNDIKQAATDTVKKAAEGQKKVAEAQESWLGRMFLASMLGGGPSNSLASMPGGEGMNYRAPAPIQQAPQQQAEVIPIDILTALKAELAAKGATPEELAVIDQLIAEQTARA